jgi:hypothetical protein
VEDCCCPDLQRLVSGLVSEDEVTKAERVLQHLGQEWGHYQRAFSATARWALCCCRHTESLQPCCCFATFSPRAASL